MLVRKFIQGQMITSLKLSVGKATLSQTGVLGSKVDQIS